MLNEVVQFSIKVPVAKSVTNNDTNLDKVKFHLPMTVDLIDFLMTCTCQGALFGYDSTASSFGANLTGIHLSSACVLDRFHSSNMMRYKS